MVPYPAPASSGMLAAAPFGACSGLQAAGSRPRQAPAGPSAWIGIKDTQLLVNTISRYM